LGVPEIPPAVEGEIFSDGQLIPSLTVTGRYSRGESVIGNTIGGGVELLDAFGQLYAENEELATIGFIGVSAVLGGPTKTILKRLAGDASPKRGHPTIHRETNWVSRLQQQHRKPGNGQYSLE
jgi:hypothetical protein